ncbi:MAG: UDP-N-acetylmuramate--L-alanine ligase [Chlamydiales bacterium]|nr:UDP-N-acetylmuramate--L-alanine ligase [Chlamydiales bacterium]
MVEIYHFIGIGGIGMSALARILHGQGMQVQGSDLQDSALLRSLAEEGISVYIGHDGNRIFPGMKVVYSSDIKPDNVEMLRSCQLGLERLHRSDLLDRCLRVKKPLLVTGTHGKTTTTSLLAHFLQETGLNPSFVIGGLCLNFQTNGHVGKGEYFVAEADESDGSFLKTAPFGAIVTNLENDHLSYWKTPEALDRAFGQFFSQVKEEKHFFWCADDPRLRALQCTFGQSYGFSEEASWKISNLKQTEKGTSFDLCHENKTYLLQAPLFGKHNALNAAAAFALALSLAANETKLSAALLSFCGVKRRLEWKKEVKTVDLFDDYGHHPTEIQATILALRQKIGTKRLVVIFQPHRYTRVQELLEEFSHSFEQADQIVLTDIYGAGETPVEGLFSLLHQNMEARLKERLHYIPKEMLVETAATLLRPHDTLLTLGAGDITHMGERILECF